MTDSTALTTLLTEHRESILGRFPKLNDWLTPEIFWTICESLRNNTKLADAARLNPNSVITALLDLAQWGLPPDGKEAFINVYNVDKVPTAQAQWIWQGGVRRAVESGVIAHAVADVIRQGDVIEETVDRHGRHLTHKRDIGAPNRKIIGAYALFWLNNWLMDYELCDREDIDRALAASVRLAGKKTPAWQYAESEQAKKTAIRRGLKRMVGKRDAAFAAMMADTHDAETTGREVDENAGELEEHEIPRAREGIGELPGSSDSLTGNTVSAHETGNPRQAGNAAQRSLSAEKLMADVCAKRGYHVFEESFAGDDTPVCGACGLRPDQVAAHQLNAPVTAEGLQQLFVDAKERLRAKAKVTSTTAYATIYNALQEKFPEFKGDFNKVSTLLYADIRALLEDV